MAAAGDGLRNAGKAHRARAEALLDIGRHAQAEREARSAMALDPRDADACLLLCRAYLAQERRPEAEQAARDAVSLDPRDGYAHYLLGFSRQMDNRHAEALEPLRAAVELAPRVGRYRSRLAIALLESGAKDEARAEIERAVPLAPEVPLVLDEAARVYSSIGEDDLAERFARDSLSKRPDTVDAHWRLSWVLGRRKNYAGAIEFARAAIAIAPNHWASWDELAHSLYHSGDYDACEKACIEALRLKPDLRAASWNLASVYLHRGWFRRAERACEALLTVDSRCDSVRALAARAAARRVEAKLKRRARLTVGVAGWLIAMFFAALIGGEAAGWLLLVMLATLVAYVVWWVRWSRAAERLEEGAGP